MTITITRLAQFHRGGSTAQNHAFTGVTLTVGARYVVVANALRNGAGGWTPSADAAVTDNAAAPSGWAWLDDSVGGGAAFTGGGTNGSAMVAFITGEITATEAGRTVTIDMASTGAVAATGTAFLYAFALYEITSDSGAVSVVQTAGSAGTSDSISINWDTAPAADLVAAWGAIHNSTATPGTEPAGLTADWTAAASVPGIEIQVGSSSADPLTFSFPVSGTDFDFHGLGIEFTDVAPPAGWTVQVHDGSALAVVGVEVHDGVGLQPVEVTVG